MKHDSLLLLGGGLTDASLVRIARLGPLESVCTNHSTDYKLINIISHIIFYFIPHLLFY